MTQHINMAATPRAKFDAAVKVIRSLPKNGSFQPSHEMMLKFYAFYKQATEGPCRDAKPSFWDVVKKAKWEAWSKLGDMPPENAMLQYVDELKMIIETMPQTQNVADFMSTLGSFYELVDDKMPFGEGLNNSPGKVGPEAEKETPSPANGEGSDMSDPSHSLVVEEVLMHTEVGNGDTAKETIEITVKTLDHNENVDNSKESDDGVQPLTNGTEEARPTLTNHVSSEMESDSEEFCDTSDEPVNIPIVSTRLSASTPLNKANNHVRFSETNIVHTEVEVHSGRVSPIEAASEPVGLGVVTLAGTYPFGQQNRPLSESMFVNAPSQDSMNISSASQLSGGRGQLEADFSGDSVISSDLNQSSTDTVKMRGGGEMEQGRQGSYQSSDKGESGGTGGARGPTSGSGSGSRRGLFSGSGGGGRRRDGDPQNPMDVNEQIAVAMVRLQQDMNGVLTRLSSLETISRHKAEEEVRRRKAVWKPSWWPFRDLSIKTAAFIVLWPFFAHFLINVLFKRKRRQ